MAAAMFDRLLHGEVTTAEYVAALKADALARADARAGIQRIPYSEAPFHPRRVKVPRP